MDDAELQAIRQARLRELQSQQPSRGPSAPSGFGGAPAAGGGDDESKRQAEEDARGTILAQILAPAARERLRRIELVRADRARGVENMLIQMARTGQIRQKVSEEELIGLLEEISGQESKRNQTKIVMQRRRDLDEDDDDWD
ncbi:DNA-binding TFAR19-related protein [Saitoella complicata NRRL Y-17804]|nr:DNA-binding TFAR19-related protein [Saitoella complicata NRRL Y-17804]ODQ50514.1 DNA-binding TFAR19-related protein [Saitoella complicata NRRL Y-17804]